MMYMLAQEQLFSILLEGEGKLPFLHYHLIHSAGLFYLLGLLQTHSHPVAGWVL